MKKQYAFIVAVVLVVLVIAAATIEPPRSYKFYNEYGEGATIAVGGGLGDVGVLFDWEHSGSTVTTVSWSYSATISNLQGVDHWNLTLEFGYKVGTGEVVKIDSRTWTFQTGTGTFSDSGSESLDTHIGRFVSNPVDGQTYSLYYYVRFKFSYLGVKSGQIYVETNDGDSVLEEADWTHVDSDSVVYREPLQIVDIVNQDTGTSVKNDLMDSSDSTYTGDSNYILRLTFKSGTLNLVLKLRLRGDMPTDYEIKVIKPGTSTYTKVDSGAIGDTFAWFSYTVDFTSYVVENEDGSYTTDIKIGNPTEPVPIYCAELALEEPTASWADIDAPSLVLGFIAAFVVVYVVLRRRTR